MDYTPRRLMYLAREGFKAEVLGSLSIWLCTSCYACAMGCPKQINTTEMMYALKRRAIEEKYYPKHFSVPVMAKQFARMVRQSGRITESWLMMRVLMRSSISSLFGMSRLGLRLFRSRRIGFLPEKIHRRGEIARMMDAVEAARKEFSV
jgi:heterodisulfide reductase subunit C